jgi:predicted lysophospholipase L1 biosynthesis ABC-type transport system permease subunit
MNLSTAEASFRLKEVGIKKSFGASRRSIASQFFGESLIVVVISLIIGLIIVFLILPEFNIITGKQLTLNADFRILGGITALTIITMFMAGGYPSIYISGFNPITIMKSRSETSLGGHQIRKGLVTFQFTLSIILIASVIVVSRQIDYIQNKHLGYNKDNIIYFEIDGNVKKNLKLFL